MPKKKTDLERRKATLGRVYFTKDTEDAIARYNECDDDFERDIIFREEIHPALDKLVENVINRFKFPYVNVSFEDLKSQVVSFLVLNLHKFTKDKGKAFSYFSVVAKNYLILQNNKAYKRQLKSRYLTDALGDESFLLEEVLLLDHDSQTDQTDARELLRLLIEFWDFNLTKIFKKDRDIQIANAFIELMRRSDYIENHNKKALYVLIREMTDAKTVHITKVLKKMRKHVNQQIKQYEKEGYISDASMYFSYNTD